MIIAEIAQAHEGSLGILHSYIDALANTGVDAIKFQVHIADAESSEFETFRVPFSYEDATRMDYWRRMEFTQEQWQHIKEHCENKGMRFIASPFSIAAVQLLQNIGCKVYKIASGEITNQLLLDTVTLTAREVIISSGMSSFEELDVAVNTFREKNIPVTVLQCSTTYPAPPEFWGLNIITALKERYHCPVGISDHSGTIYPCLAAATLGASCFEFHVVFHKEMFGPDTLSSIAINEIKMLVDGIRLIQTANEHPVEKNNINQYENLKNAFGKSLAVNKSLKAGDQISINDLETKKPALKGIHPSLYKTILGKKLVKDISIHSFLTMAYFNQSEL